MKKNRYADAPWPLDTFLGRLPELARKDVLHQGLRRSYERGHPMIEEGDASSHILVILAGRVKVSAHIDGQRRALLAVRGRGEIVGEMAAIDGGLRSARVVACDDLEVREVKDDAFRGFLDAEPSARDVVNRIVVERLREVMRRQVDLSRRPAGMRVARILADLCGVHGLRGDEGIKLDYLTNDELAATANCDTGYVGLILHDMQAKGIIEKGYRSITVCNRTALDRYVGPARGPGGDGEKC